MAVLNWSIFRISFAILAALILLVVSQSAGSISAATLNVDGADGGCNDGVGTPYCTIGAAVGDATPGDTINVFPGTYPENVNLNGMSVPGDISLTTVDATGTPTASTATISPGSGIAIAAFSPDFPGDIFISGFTVLSTSWGIDIRATGSVTLVDVTANNNGEDGANIGTTGAVTITDSTANGNGNEGFIVPFANNVTISGSTADGNGDDGFDTRSSGTTSVSGSNADGNGGDGFDHDDEVIGGPGTLTITTSHASGNGTVESADNFDLDFGGNVTISDSSGNGSVSDDGFDVETASNVTITGSTANGNDDEGFELDIAGDVVLDRVTANNNDDDGADIECLQIEGCDRVDNITVRDSVFIGNGSSGIDFDGEGGFHEPAGTYLVNGNIICQNVVAGFSQNSDIATNSEGNWWGDASGPEHPNNATPGTGDKVLDGVNPTDDDGFGLTAGTTDFDPWIDTIAGSGDDTTQGQPVVVTFEFTDTSVALQQGPGDANGDPTFAATTDNGTVSTSGFVSDGKLEVTLTPENAGTATVTVTGPCGLDGSTGGNTVVLNVAAAPVGLPETGGSPVASDGGGLNALAIVLLAVVALALAGAGGGAVAITRRP